MAKITGAHVIRSCTQGQDLNLELKSQQYHICFQTFEFLMWCWDGPPASLAAIAGTWVVSARAEIWPTQWPVTFSAQESCVMGYNVCRHPLPLQLAADSGTRCTEPTQVLLCWRGHGQIMLMFIKGQCFHDQGVWLWMPLLRGYHRPYNPFIKLVKLHYLGLFSQYCYQEVILEYKVVMLKNYFCNF